jgi:peptidoglycan/LPS O-acetylase OafA/YrhL
LGEHSEGAAGFPQKYSQFWNWIFDGDLAVHFFFAISGFLITYLLLREQEETARIDLGRFYARRALRILPVYFAFLFVMFLIQEFSPWHQPEITWVANLTFTTNFLPGNGVTGHLWSLAVEEQFYFLWPVLLSLVVGMGGRAIYALMLLPLLSAPVFRVLAYMHKFPAAIAWMFGGHSFFLHDDTLAIGCVAAIIFVKHESAVSSLMKTRPLVFVMTALVLLVVPYILTHALRLGMFTVPFGLTAEVAGFTLLMIQSIVSPGWYSLLNRPIVCWVGVLSYSIYIWQQIFCRPPGTFGPSTYWFTTFPWWLPAALLVAVISYYCLEKPLMGLRSKLRVTKTV